VNALFFILKISYKNAQAKAAMIFQSLQSKLTRKKKHCWRYLFLVTWQKLTYLT